MKMRLKNKTILTLRKTTKRNIAKKLYIHNSQLRWKGGLLQKLDENNHWAPIPRSVVILKNG